MLNLCKQILNSLESFQMLSKQVKLFFEVYSSYTYFKENDVLLARVTPCFENGKSGIARGLTNNIGFGSSEFFVLRAIESKILPEWLYYNISSFSFINNGRNHMIGTGGLQRLTKDYVINYRIPLPPLEVQQQIVEQINEEQAIVNQNKRLIEIFEQKIKDKIAEVWGEEKSSKENDDIAKPSQSSNKLTMKYAARNCTDKFMDAVKRHKKGDNGEPELEEYR